MPCSFSCPYWKHEEIFLWSSLGLLEFLTLKFVHTKPLAILQLQCRFSYPGTGSQRGFHGVSYDSLYPPVCLPKFGDSSLSCNLSSLMDLRRVVDFQFVQFFLIVRMGMRTSKLLITCLARNQKSSFNLYLNMCIHLFYYLYQ